ncbi:MAG: AAA family ATPase, partial [Planctomycetes bacterium]|nr:AAA family ATPase [Planctomycetota bacterium]
MKLVVRKGPGEGMAFALPAEGTAVLGRGAESSILLAHSSVSSRHAAIHSSGGTLLLEDLGSTNGTILNGKKIERAVLRPGDVIRIGAFAFECVDDAEPAPAPPAPRPADVHEHGSAPPDEAKWRDAIARLGEARERILGEMRKRIVGQEEVIEDLLIALFARGHALLVGVPGLAKTLMVRTLASLLALEFRRIQFTPDLMPADITGTEILEDDPSTRARSFKFIRGPIFTNILLADEINRTPPKTQAALLEAMQEYRVTAAGTTYDLAPPFFVLATQNPIEQEGT